MKKFLKILSVVLLLSFYPADAMRNHRKGMKRHNKQFNQRNLKGSFAKHQRERRTKRREPNTTPFVFIPRLSPVSCALLAFLLLPNLAKAITLPDSCSNPSSPGEINKCHQLQHAADKIKTESSKPIGQQQDTFFQQQQINHEKRIESIQKDYSVGKPEKKWWE